MEKIIEKLTQIENGAASRIVWDSWSLQEQKQLLDIYLLISTKESQIFSLIYSYHGCDSWEDIFRDYDIRYLKDKASGVKEAINAIKESLDNP
jgi:hypothetical protein